MDQGDVMIIAGLQKLSLIDYPDYPAVVLFTAGCNLDCYYCHNSELKDLNEVKTVYDIKWIMKFLIDRYKYLKHVVICGGEPMIHGKSLYEFIKGIKSIGYSVKVDTNGTIFIDDNFYNLIDFFAMDLKAPLSKYESIVGRKVDKDIILKNVENIKKKAKNYIFRTTLIPDLTDDDIEKIKIDFNISNNDKYILQEYRRKQI